jgi:chorismate mutase
MKVISVVLNLLGACALAISGGQPRDLSTVEQFGPLVDASAQRIEVARQVAFAKWDSHRPVEDQRREDEVISAAVAQGVDRGLNREFVARIFKAQIDANKFVQYALLSEWRRLGSAPQHPQFDLSRTIRPELDTIQSRLIDELVVIRNLRRIPSCKPRLSSAIDSYLAQHQDFTPVEAAALQHSLAPVCLLSQ